MCEHLYPKTLILVRHGEDNGSTAEQPILTSRGVDQMQRVTRGSRTTISTFLERLMRVTPNNGLVLVSCAPRSEESGKIIAGNLGIGLKTLESLGDFNGSNQNSSRQIVSDILEVCTNRGLKYVIAVGHDPSINEVATDISQGKVRSNALCYYGRAVALTFDHHGKVVKTKTL